MQPRPLPWPVRSAAAPQREVIGSAPAGDIVILALPYASAAPVVSQYGDALAGKVIVDISNAFDRTGTGLVTPDGSSAAQETAKAAPASAHVVKAFNTLFGHVLAADQGGGRPLDVFIAATTPAPRHVCHRS